MLIFLTMESEILLQRILPLFIYTWQGWVSGGAPGDAGTAWWRGWDNGCDGKMNHHGWGPSWLHLFLQVYPTFLSWPENQCHFPTGLANLFGQVKKRWHLLLKSSNFSPFSHYFFIPFFHRYWMSSATCTRHCASAGEAAMNTTGIALAFRDQLLSSTVG